MAKKITLTAAEKKWTGVACGRCGKPEAKPGATGGLCPKCFDACCKGQDHSEGLHKGKKVAGCPTCGGIDKKEITKLTLNQKKENTMKKTAAPVKRIATTSKAAALPKKVKAPAAKKAQGEKRMKFFETVSALAGVRWMYENGVALAAVQAVCKKFGVVVSDASARTLYCPNFERVKAGKFSHEQGAQIKKFAAGVK